VLRIVIAGPDERLISWLADAIAPAQGFEVVGTAVDGEGALDVVRHTRPEVALVDADIEMPPRGGLTLVAAIIEALPETLVVVLAGQALEETAEAALAAGAVGLLAKDGSVQIPADLGWPDLGKGPGPGPSLSRSAS
jgi:DNA-binding NarL/FixJ family response regulator